MKIPSPRAHPRLIVASVAGVAVFLALAPSLGMLTGMLVGWNVTAWGYLVLMGLMMSRADHDRMLAIAEQEDEGAALVLAIVCLAAAGSFAAIVLDLATTPQSSGPARGFNYLLTGSTVAGSWLMVGTVFTAHYARMFYAATPGRRPLRFPDGEETPDYWDFLYFAFTIAVAVQTSDVLVMTRSMRKVVTAHSVLSFAFNVAILGFSINVVAGLVGR
jgi:uncharacterized membrane protein